MVFRSLERIGVTGHVLRHFDRAAVLEKDGDARCPPGVVTDPRGYPWVIQLGYAAALVNVRAVLVRTQDKY